MRLATTLIFILLSTLSQAEVRIDQAYVRALLPGQANSAAFMVFYNDAEEDIYLQSVDTDMAEQAELHEHIHSGDMMRMQQVQRLRIPAKGFLNMRSGGYHLMLLGLSESLREGDQLTLRFHFSDGSLQQHVLPIKSLFNES